MSHSPSRRGLLQASAGLLLASGLRADGETGSLNPAVVPTAMTLFGEAGAFPLTRKGQTWQGVGTEVETLPGADALTLRLSSRQKPMRLHVRWSGAVSSKVRLLGDAWERSYGDLCFRGIEPERVMPWYVAAVDGKWTRCFGVKTGASALCFWQVDPAGISLWCDVRNGGRGVDLGERRITVAEIVRMADSGGHPFQALQRFCRVMCTKPRLPKAPIYGGNNWYFAYGKSSASDILADSERVASVSTSTTNPPWMVIDDGWSINATAGPWRTGGPKFPDMPKLAADMVKVGVRPAIWTRPLFTKAQIPSGAQLRPNTLDPTHSEAKALIQEDMRTVISWGYQMVKHDFSTFDVLGRWGFQMGAEVTGADWNFHDGTRTSAEVIRELYLLLREAAAETPLLGCNTVGHLAAGIFEAQRIGDDTSGRDWNRTRRMGVNTLAFRMPQHNAFFAVDADCVGLTKRIDWKLNRQWLDLLAGSGTPLFVSIAPDALGAEQRVALRDAFQVASVEEKVAEPLDWMGNNQPAEWLVRGKRAKYEWFVQEGGSPFSG